MTILKLLLVRHGQSVGNTEGRMEGVGSTELTPLGRQQALCLGQHLATTAWQPTHIYCSPLERATATLSHLLHGLKTTCSQDAPSIEPAIALPVGWALPTNPEILDDLKEYDAGIFTGLTWTEASAQYPDLCHQLETSLDWQPIPQAETLAEGSARAQRVVDRLLSHSNGDRVLVISHHWILQQIIARLLGCDRAWGLPMANTACFEFWLDRDRWNDPGPNRLNTELWQIKRFNDTSHLQP
jgi:broad specificity phosphatase PhoE